MVVLNYVLIGKWSLMSVIIEEGKTVALLKTAIKAGNSNTITCEAKDLQLFLAKTPDGTWLLGADVASVVLDDHGHPQGYAEMDPSLWIKNDMYFGDFQAEKGQVHVLVVIPEDVPILGHRRGRGEDWSSPEKKRRTLEGFPDAWTKAIKDTQFTELPSTCEDLKERGNGVVIKFGDDAVVKTYPRDMPSDAIIRNLRILHQLMKEHSVPNVVELGRTNMKKKYVVLKPIGLPFQPRNVHQLLTALRDILKALVAMHAINLMHRDLRWKNVLKYPGDKWFLIDFDGGALSPAAEVHHLKAESHAPENLWQRYHLRPTRSRLTFGAWVSS